MLPAGYEPAKYAMFIQLLSLSCRSAYMKAQKSDISRGTRDIHSVCPRIKHEVLRSNGCGIAK